MTDPAPGPDPWSGGRLEPRPTPPWFWLLALVALLYHLPFSLLGEQRDAGELLVTGEQLLHGHPAYTKGYMPKTPGVAYLLAGLFAVVGPNLLAARALVLAANLVGAWAVAGLTRAQGWSGRTAFLAGVLYLFAAPQFEGAQILTEPFLVPFAVLAAWAVLKCEQTGQLRWVALAGVRAAAALWMKQVGVLMMPPTLALLGIAFLRQPARRGRLAMAAVVFLASWASALGLLVATAVGPVNREAFLNCVVFGLLRRRQTTMFEASPLFEVSDLPAIWVPALLLLAVAVFRRPAPGGASNGPLWYTGGLMVFSFLPLLHRQFPHYSLPALPFAAILAAVFWDATARRLSGWPVVFGGLVLISLAWPAWWLWGAVADLNRGANVFHNLRVGDELRSLIAGRPVLIPGVEPEYYFLCRAEPPTPHLYMLDENLSLAAPDRQMTETERRREVLRELASRYDYQVLLLFNDPWAVEKEWPEDRQRDWVRVGTVRAWEYESRGRYAEIEIRVLVRRPPPSKE